MIGIKIKNITLMISVQYNNTTTQAAFDLYTSYRKVFEIYHKTMAL